MNLFATPNTSHLSSLKFKDVYQPAEDSFLFLDALEKDWKIIESLRPALCIEMGCGSGIISSFVAENLSFPCFMLCIDINRAALCATEMSFRNRSNITAVLDIIQSDLVATLLPVARGTVDLILFNPPYVVTPSDEVNGDDPIIRAWAGGPDGRLVMDRFFPQAAALLRPKGIMYILCLKENKIDELKESLGGFGFEAITVLTRKCRNEELFVFRCVRG